MKTILAAVDTSQSSKSVFKEALVLASTIRARVVAVSVTPEYEGNMNRFCIDDSERELNEPFVQILKEAQNYATSLGLDMQAIHRSGKPPLEIIRVAKEEEANLIMLGCSRRHQMERMLLGRTIAEIIMGAPCDVMLVPLESEILFGNILVGISGSAQGLIAEQRAFEVAMSYGSKVHGLYSIDIPTDRSFRYGVMQDAEQRATKILDDFVAHGAKFGVSVITEMRWNTPEKCLAQYAEEHDINLIILESLKHSGILKMLGGSIVEKIASLATCPVLVVHPETDTGDNLVDNLALNA